MIHPISLYPVIQSQFHLLLGLHRNENDVRMENSVTEKIPFIDKKPYIPVILTGTIKKMMQIIRNLNVHLEVNATEEILIISNNTTILSSNQLNNENQNVKVENQHMHILSVLERTECLASDDDDEDDDDGLPNEYDYNDSFIDDEELDDSVRVDRAGTYASFFQERLIFFSLVGDSLGDPDHDWKPQKKTPHNDGEDDDNNSSDDSEVDLLKEEAAEFVQGSSSNHQRPAKKKARMQMPKDDD